MLAAMRTALLAALAAAIAVAAPGAAQARTVFHAVCGNLQGQRVDLDPDGGNKLERWRPEFYRAGPPPDGQGTLEFISEDDERDHITIKWGGPPRSLPIVYRSNGQISIADVDESGVWIFTLLYRAGKVMVTRQTTIGGPGTTGALLTADCEFKPR